MLRQTGSKAMPVSSNAGKNVPVNRPTGKLMRLRCRVRPLFENYYTNGQISERDCDVTFVCQGGQMQAHKVILSIASKFFCQIFQEQKPSKSTIVHVPDINVNTMKLILELCYKENAVVPVKAMKDLGSYLSMFGLAWDQFHVSDELPSSKHSVPTTNSASGRGAVQPKQIALTTQAMSKGQVIIKPNRTLYGISGKMTPGPIIATDSYSLANVSQTYVLDKKTSSNLVDDSNDSEFTVNSQVHKFAQSKQAGKFQQPRLILPKPPGMIQQFTYRAANGPPVLQKMSDSSSSDLHVLSQSQDTPGIEVDVDGNHDSDEPADSPEAQKMLNLWMASVGKSEMGPPKLPRTDTSPVKRRASPAASSPRCLKGGVSKVPKRQCSVCFNAFEDDAKWRWHEDRHVGINLFKCTLCSNIFTTSRKVYQHEMMEHGIMGTFDDNTGSDLTAEMIVRSNNQLVGHESMDDTTPRVTVVTTQYGTHYRRLPGSSPKKMKTLTVRKYKQAHYAKLHNNFANKNPSIGIGDHEGHDMIESRKLKQLHWLYVCNKCEACSDSSAKAIAHYRLCYPEREKRYEESVVKFRQGFYGKIKCCLCPRRYTSLAGFLIHCGHMHQDYRQLFSHISSEDKMICVNCRDKFDGPDTFHSHLSINQRCERPTKEDLAHNLMAAYQDGSSNPSFEESRKNQYTKLLGTNPRSARLQNRLAAVTACFEDDPVNEESFTAVACPICSEAEISNLTDHIHTSHSELDIRVERLEESTLRCKACGITFAICDLLAHSSSCTGSKGLHHVLQRKTSSTGSSQKPPKPKVVIEYPPGIGTSPIETMDESNLMSIDVLRAALQCAVCKRNGKKMNVIAECLRTHGVYRCAVCFNSYLSKEQNSLHLKKCHANNVGRLICPVCNIVRSNAGQLLSHMYNTHWLPILNENAVDARRDKLLSKMHAVDTSVNGGIENEEVVNNSADMTGVEGNDSIVSEDTSLKSVDTLLEPSVSVPEDAQTTPETVGEIGSNEVEVTANTTKTTTNDVEINETVKVEVKGATDEVSQ